jgi:hypothetical protein
VLDSRLVLTVPPLVLLTIWLACLTRGWPPAARSLAGLSWLAATWLTYFAGPVPPLPHLLLGTPDSDELWTFTLQSPNHRIERRQPTHAFPADGTLIARYVWDEAARPKSSRTAVVTARVNGALLDPGMAGDDPSEYWCCTLRWHVPASVIARAQIATVEVWMAERDPRVRFVAQRNPRAASIGAPGSLFFDGTVLMVGVPHTSSASVRSGFPHLWLDPA